MTLDNADSQSRHIYFRSDAVSVATTRIAFSAEVIRSTTAVPLRHYEARGNPDLNSHIVNEQKAESSKGYLCS